MSADEKLEILHEIRDRQKESLDLQREQFAFIKKHYDRAEAIQEKAEKLQNRASGMMKILLPVVAAVLALIIYILMRDF